MSLETTTNRVSYAGNDVTTAFSFPYYFLANGDLVVILTDADGLETTQTITTHYTVTGAGESAGGTVTMLTAPATGETLTIYRDAAITQGLDLIENGALPAEPVEQAFDRLTMICQRLDDQINRAVLKSDGFLDTFDLTLPSDLATANATIVVNATADGWDMGPTTTEIENAETNATAAAASAAAASASATLASQWASLTSGQVAATDYSAKAWAIGGTGVTDTASRGAAKEWAIETASTVDGADYSAKEHAVGTQTRGVSGGGSSKDWATYTGGTVDDVEYSAKHYADAAATSAAETAALVETFEYNQVPLTSVDSPVAPGTVDPGSLYLCDCTGGNIIIGLPQISTLSLPSPWAIIVKKTDSSANTVTMNLSGPDTIDGVASSKVVSRENSALYFIPGVDTNNWVTLGLEELTIAGAPVGDTDAQVLTSKTFDDELTMKEIATPSSPASGYQKLYFDTADSKLKRLNSSGEEIEVGSGASPGIKNYFDGGDFETNTSLATVYDDTGAYVDGAGGSPTIIEVAQNISTPLAGAGDLRITKGTGDGSGEGVTFLSETIDRSDRGRNLFIEFEWDGTAAGYTDGDFELKAYSNGTDATILPVVPLAGLNENRTLPALKTKVVAYIPTSTDTDSTINVSLHLASDSLTGSSYNVYLDDIKLSPGGVYPSAILTPWVSYSPTVGGVTGGSYTATAYYRRVGNELEVKFDVVWGTIFTGGSNPTISLPSGLTIDSTKIPNTTSALFELGKVLLFDNGVATMRGKLLYTSTSSVSIYAVQYDQGSGTDQEYGQNLTTTVPFTWANNDRIMGSFKVPISKWEASAAVSTVDLGLQTISAVYTVSASSANLSFADATSEVVDFDTKVIDTHNAVTTGASWKFTAPRAGKYLVSANNEWTSSTNLNDSLIDVYKNGTFLVRLGANFQSPYVVGSAQEVSLNKGDYIDIRLYQQDTVSGARTLTSSSYRTNVSIVSRPDLTIYGAYAEKNKVQNKYLAANATDGDFSELTFSNLTIGKFYQISLYGNFVTDTTDDEVFINITHNGSTIGVLGTDNGGAAYNQVIAITTVFQAAATTLTFTSVSATANAYAAGNGTKGQTWAQLEERNDLIETSAW